MVLENTSLQTRNVTKLWLIQKSEGGGIVQSYSSPQMILYVSWESLLSNTPNRYFPENIGYW